MKKLLLPMFLLAACAAPAVSDDQGNDSAFSSNQATLLDFEFDSELTTASSWNPRGDIDAQMLYTIGHLNTNRSVARLDKIEVTNIVKEDAGPNEPGGMTRVKFHVKIPVAWASKTSLPETYDFVFPKRVDYEGQEAFTAKYKEDCVDWGAHDVTSGSMWYYYRPRASGCRLEDADVVKLTARAKKSTENSTGKYPEYDKVWSDGILRVVAVFGKYEDGATSAGDAGIAAYNQFLVSIRRALGDGVKTTPAEVPPSPGIRVPDVTFEATLPGDRKVQVVTLLVDNVRTAGEAFDKRYEELSTDADLIVYNGHAGLGSNVRALARKGKFKAGQYQIFFMNGCDTFAYVDGSLAQTRARLNPDDPTGTKYMEIVTNAMPSYFSSMPYASMALLNGLLAKDRPKTYDQIFDDIDDAEVVVVTGEEDNVFTP